MLDERQEEAVKHMEGPCMVLAGPGSGKTTVITGRVKYLIQERGVPEERILVVTFTRAAAREMEERFLRLMGKTRSGVCFGTFHSVFYRILSKASGGKETVLGPGEQRRLLTEVCRGEKIACNDEEEFLDYVTKEIGKARCRGQIPVEEGVHRIYEKYEELKRREGKIDFDDMMTRTRALLMEREDVLLAWRDAFRFIMIDEFQDINPMQYEIIRLLAAPENNLFIVGDDDQSIYGFRGSDPSIMLHFPEDFPETTTVLLDTN
jgi:DNA helicase-2/ATP-dependent DNA helicase PcrA